MLCIGNATSFWLEGNSHTRKSVQRMLCIRNATSTGFRKIHLHFEEFEFSSPAWSMPNKSQINGWMKTLTKGKSMNTARNSFLCYPQSKSKTQLTANPRLFFSYAWFKKNILLCFSSWKQSVKIWRFLVIRLCKPLPGGHRIMINPFTFIVRDKLCLFSCPFCPASLVRTSVRICWRKR